MRRVLLPQEITGDLPSSDHTVLRLAGRSMGTTWSVQVVHGPDDPSVVLIEADILAAIDVVVSSMSHWLADSDLSRFNAAPAGSWQQLPPDFFRVLSCGRQVAELSGGAFDPFVGALVNLWGFGANKRFDEAGFHPPTPEAVAAVQSEMRGKRVLFDADAQRVQQPGGVLLDLSSIAKGYSVDKIATALAAQGFAHYLVEVGGELRGAGMKPDGQPWWVELEEVPGAPMCKSAVALHGLAVATSGDYRRYFEQEQLRRSHTIDPRNGMPISHGVASVTVIHPECMLADAYSTALTVMGVEQGLPFAEQHGIAARFIEREGSGVNEHASSHYMKMSA